MRFISCTLAVHTNATRQAIKQAGLQVLDSDIAVLQVKIDHYNRAIDHIRQKRGMWQWPLSAFVLDGHANALLEQREALRKKESGRRELSVKLGSEQRALEWHGADSSAGATR